MPVQDLRSAGNAVPDPAASLWLRRHRLIACLIVVLCALSFRLLISLRSDQTAVMKENADASTYFLPAFTLLDRGAFLDVFGRPEITRTPGYPGFLAGLMQFLGREPRPVLIAQTVIVSFQVLALYVLALRVMEPLSAFVAGIIAAFSPWGAVLAGFPMSDGLFLLLLTLVFLVMRKTIDASTRVFNWLGAVIIGLLVACAILVRPFWPLVVLVGAMMIFLYGYKRATAWGLTLVMLLVATAPVYLWKKRNQQASQFNGLSDIAGQCAWQFLAQRVMAQVTAQDKWVLKNKAVAEENSWKLPIEKADRERWRRVSTIFAQYPLLTGYYFFLSGFEHAMHPSPEVLAPAGFDFAGDYWLLAALWVMLLSLAWVGWFFRGGKSLLRDRTERHWLTMLLLVCGMLTFSSGLCFGAGARYRAALEIIVPLLAGMGITHLLSRLGLICKMNRVA